MVLDGAGREDGSLLCVLGGYFCLDLGFLLVTHTEWHLLGTHEHICVEGIHVSTSRLSGVVAPEIV